MMPMILHRSIRSLSIALSALALSAAPLKAATFIDFKNGETLNGNITLTGEVRSEGWTNLNNVSTPNTVPTGPGANSSHAPYGGHNLSAGWYHWSYDPLADEGFGAWVRGGKATIASNVGTGTSTLWKKGGYGYLAGTNIHQGQGTGSVGSGGNFELTIAPMENLETVIFQLQGTNRPDAPGNEKVFFTLPVIRIGENVISATDSLLYGKIEGYSAAYGGQDMTYYAFQWDLRGYTITEPITLEWTGINNAGIFGLQLDQSDTYVQVVPEPSTWALITIAGVAGLAQLRRRKKAA